MTKFEELDNKVLYQLRFTEWFSLAELVERTGLNEYEVQESLIRLFLQGITVERCHVTPELLYTRLYAKFYQEEQ